MLDEVPEDMSGETGTPASGHLFTVSDKPELLDGPPPNYFIVIPLSCCSYRGGHDLIYKQLLHFSQGESRHRIRMITRSCAEPCNTYEGRST
jgi:hypothetical protein